MAVLWALWWWRSGVSDGGRSEDGGRVVSLMAGAAIYQIWQVEVMRMHAPRREGYACRR